MSTERKQHWDNVYATRQPEEVSWTQSNPATSLSFIHSFNVPKTASIVDVGGGDSKLVDFLLDEGYKDLTVLDISGTAIERARARLGKRASAIKWIVTDVIDFQPKEKYDVWHDRATFHFLTTQAEINSYLDTASAAVTQYLVIGTFSTAGPPKCSGLAVRQYSEAELQSQVARGFEKIRCITEDHVTPFNTTQNFLFCSFRRVQ